ncbi:hypothetical protein CPAR01_02856 [Colletotrichum paranaense]|uniref:Uncharacterized protein n=2 Tax=Colletotrichum acutatum species complex TaxID=2707335 RepID=A0AAI9U5L6_9PEZI|nr:uncharacterized protein CPAR01_02856 [Colletotrichum paranaense]KAK1452091.1 hypothetical protein CMEL01_06665 [Colletotrichum melonis]KAK1545354.1 hypothetical protein CPAR01_02856 [Colletotrichum paranaense]
MHTCFIALASASVLHLPLWSSVVYGYMVPIRASRPCLSISSSPSPSGTLAGSL